MQALREENAALQKADKAWGALNVIRDMLDLTGAKEGCGAGECGARHMQVI